jgi:hypothetical protein
VFVEQQCITASLAKCLDGFRPGRCDTEISVVRFLRPHILFIYGTVRWVSFDPADNPENVETEGASVAGMKGD